MAGRIRTIKPELLEDQRTAGLTDAAMRLFIGMILLSDDYGNLRADPELLSASVFWAAPVRPDAPALLEELHESGLVVRYEVRRQGYVHLAGWAKHQRVDKPGKPRVPSMDDPDAWSPRLRDDRDHVYFMRSGTDGPIKIGVARDPVRRLAELQTACAEILTLVGVLPDGGGIRRERELHRRFDHVRLSGEWFAADPELIAFIGARSIPWDVANSSRAVREEAASQSRLTSDLRPPITIPTTTPISDPAASPQVSYPQTANASDSIPDAGFQKRVETMRRSSGAAPAEAIRVADYLAISVGQSVSKAEHGRWCWEIDRVMREDGVSEGELTAAVDWAATQTTPGRDGFPGWRALIVDGFALTKHYRKLVAGSRAARVAPKATGTDWGAIAAELKSQGR